MTRAADVAVVSSSWFDFVTVLASFGPEFFKLFHCFCAISEQLFDVRREACEISILIVVLIELLIDRLAIGSLFLLMSKLFSQLLILRSARLDHHCPKVIEHDSIQEC